MAHIPKSFERNWGRAYRFCGITSHLPLQTDGTQNATQFIFGWNGSSIVSGGLKSTRENKRVKKEKINNVASGGGMAIVRWPPIFAQVKDMLNFKDTHRIRT